MVNLDMSALSMTTFVTKGILESLVLAREHYVRFFLKFYEN